MSFTAKELENAFRNIEDFYWSELDWGTPDPVEVNGVSYPVECVEADTGGEGHGEYVFIVVRVDGRLFRKEGFYASHYGTDWDGSFEEVEQYTKKVTAYRPVS